MRSVSAGLIEWAARLQGTKGSERVEMWRADFRDAAEVGISPMSVAWGAFSFSLRSWVIANAIPLVVMSSVGSAAVVAGVMTTNLDPGAFRTTATGQTYGSVFQAQSPDDEPDLIEAVATNGRHGYVLRADLDESNGQAASRHFRSPGDALAWQAAQGSQDTQIPVYQLDGVTVVGWLPVGD